MTLLSMILINAIIKYDIKNARMNETLQIVVYSWDWSWTKINF